MTIVYRRRDSDGRFEVGEINLPVEINRTGMDEWCQSRICETWSEQGALRIVNALQKQENKK